MLNTGSRICRRYLGVSSISMAGDTKDIVIIGGGIIGCTTAYYLTRHPSYDRTRHRITLLEASKIAGGASGKAGGLLAVRPAG